MGRAFGHKKPVHQEFLYHRPTSVTMKILGAAICLLAVGASAQVGPSGIVSPDGKNVQFTHDQANNIAVAGPSGIVTKDGKNIQLTHGQATLNAAIPAPVAPLASPLAPTLTGLVGASGIVQKSGNTQFTREQAEDILLIGPSGIVTKSGKNIQLRSKRHTIGDGSAILADGTLVQFQHGTVAPYILLEGPSGILWSNGQLTQKRAKRSLIGPSGMLYNGVPVQFSHAEGQLRSKLTPDQYTRAIVVGPSGAVALDGKNIQFDAPDEPTVLLEGPSGTVMSDGTLIQKRAKRSLIGPSGMLHNGAPVQFSHAEGQLRSKLTPDQYTRAIVVGPSGAVALDGKNTQFAAPAAPTVLL